jgi:hypothetical protein
LRLAERAEIRKKNIGNYFIFTSRWVRPWLKELAERYKEAIRPDGESAGTIAMPMIPMVVLPSYYDSIRDKEVALFAGLLIKDDCNFEYIRAFRELLGANPWDWFRNREFVRLGIGRVQDKRTGGVLNWKIAKLMGRLWGECCGNTATYRTIGDVVREIGRVQRCSYFGVLTYLVEDCGVGDYFYKLRLLLLIASSSDGFGLGLWVVDASELKSPLTSDLRLFLRTWFPDYRRYGSVDDAIGLFGFDRDCDFFYAMLGYKELQRRNPSGCHTLSTTYLRWYDNCTRKEPRFWRELLLDVDF